MELILVIISIVSLISNVVLVWHFTKNRVFLPATTEYLPLPVTVQEQDAADEQPEEVVPAAVKVGTITSAWENRTNIQQGVAAPAPPIVREQLPPLARPAGFV